MLNSSVTDLHHITDEERFALTRLIVVAFPLESERGLDAQNHEHRAALVDTLCRIFDWRGKIDVGR